MDWEALIDEAALQTLLPIDHRHFAAPVKEALCVFLGGLSPQRQQEVFESQVELPATATVSARLGAMARCCPVLQKLGQTLAREPRLAIELRHELQQLESLAPTVDLPTIEQILTRELGPLAARGVYLEPPAIAEASVAVVIPFREVSSHSAQPRQGVFKILKPGVEARLEEELGLLEKVGAHLDDRCHALGIPPLDYEDSFRQVREKLACELQLEQEQRHLKDAGRFYASEPTVQIPAVLDHCSGTVTAMERVFGAKVTDCPYESDDARDRFRTLVTRALISRPLLTTAWPLLHGDPHAGNLFRTIDGRLAILDWSLVGTLTEKERVSINQILIGAITLRRTMVVQVLEGLAERHKVDLPTLANVVDTWMQKLRRGQFPGFRWLIGLMDEATQAARLRVNADMMLFRKSVLTIEGVLSELGAQHAHFDAVLLTDFVRQFGAEWYRRWFAAPSCRAFGTRLSNLDLAETILQLAWTPARFWIDESRDMLRNLGHCEPYAFASG
jgi:ubiquinone biosynthesis protein